MWTDLILFYMIFLYITSYKSRAVLFKIIIVKIKLIIHYNYSPFVKFDLLDTHFTPYLTVCQVFFILFLFFRTTTEYNSLLYPPKAP